MACVWKPLFFYIEVTTDRKEKEGSELKDRAVCAGLATHNLVQTVKM